ncbi:hypothetical protein [Streptomyces goshikiensis]
MLLTYEQVRAYVLPATEGKSGDPRWPAFARRYGFDIERPMQWEVEALEPAELQRPVFAAVDPYIDRTVLAQHIAREEEQSRALADFFGGWGAQEVVPPSAPGCPATHAVQRGRTQPCAAVLTWRNACNALLRERVAPPCCTPSTTPATRYWSAVW